MDLLFDLRALFLVDYEGVCTTVCTRVLNEHFIKHREEGTTAERASGETLNHIMQPFLVLLILFLTKAAGNQNMGCICLTFGGVILGFVIMTLLSFYGNNYSAIIAQNTLRKRL